MKFTSYKFYRFLFICFLLPLSLCGQALPLPGEIILGVTTLEELKDKGRVAKYISNGITAPVVNAENMTINFFSEEEQRVSRIRIELIWHDLPSEWDSLGFDSPGTFDNWFVYLTRKNYTIVIPSYPHYSLAGSAVASSARIKAVHPDSPEILIDLIFKETAYELPVHLTTLLSQVDINLRDNATSYKDQYLFPTGETITLPLEKRQALAMSGFLGESNSSNHETLAAHNGVIDRYKSSLKTRGTPEERAKGFLDIWEIYSREEYFKAIKNLDESGHSANMITLLDSSRNIETKQHRSILDYAATNNWELYLKNRLIFIQQFKDFPGLRERSLRAWDYGRSIYISRMAYQANLISEEEAWESILKQRDKITRLYSSWEDYGANYILGRMFWASGSGMKKIDTAGDEAFLQYSKLLHTENSAWMGPWPEPSSDREILFYTKMEDVLNVDTKEQIAFEAFLEGNRFYTSQLYEGAIKELNRALEYEGFYYPHLSLGFTLIKMNESFKAEEHFRIYHEAYPRDYYGAIYYGEICERNDNWQMAEKCFLKALEINPELSDSYKNLARLYLKKENPEEAGSIMTKYEESIIPDNQDYYAEYLIAAAAFGIGEYEKSIDYLNRCYEAYNENSYINFLLGSSYHKQSTSMPDLASLYLKRARKLGFDLPSEYLIFLENEDKK